LIDRLLDSAIKGNAPAFERLVPRRRPVAGKQERVPQKRGAIALCAPGTLLIRMANLVGYGAKLNNRNPSFRLVAPP
jgi:hypothetical protein